MKTREQIVKELNYHGTSVGVSDDDTSQFSHDMYLLISYAEMKYHHIGLADTLAIGYMAGQSDLKAIFNNEEELRKAIIRYDKDDITNLSDTVAELFIDLLNYKD